MDAVRPAQPASAASTARRVIWALGVSQFISIGTVFYSFALLAPGVSREFDTPAPLLFAVLSAGLALSGFLGPWIGRTVDRIGGPKVLVAGSLATAASFLLLAGAPNLYVFDAGILLLQMSSVAIMFSVAAPTVAQFVGPGAPRAITLLSLIMGLSASAFVPLIGLLDAQLGWRGAYAGLALVHLVLALPCHLALLPLPRYESGPQHAASPDDGDGIIAPAHRRFAFWAVALSLSLSSSVAMGIAFQLVPILHGAGLGPEAFAVAAIIGPAQVAIRLAQATLLRSVRPLPLAIGTSLVLGSSIAIMLIGLPTLPAAVAFVSVYGLAQGLAVIISSTLPLELFGRRGFGELLGRMALLRVVLNAPAPFLLTALWAGFNLGTALMAFVAIGLASSVPLVLVARLIRQRAATPG